MNQVYDPKPFWDERFKKYGHTGEADRLLYAYDQPQRLQAIDRSLSQAGVVIDGSTKILDIGCGAGDMIELLLKYDKPKIVGLDISDQVVNSVQERFAGHPSVKCFNTSVETMDFPVSFFDLVISVNVLQHVIVEPEFAKVVQRIAAVVKKGGHILTMDFSPAKRPPGMPSPYVIIRSRQEYIDAFVSQGCELVLEFGLPRLGARLYRLVEKILVGLVRGVRHSKANAVQESSLKSDPVPSLMLRIVWLLRTSLLTMSRPFDQSLVPFPSKYTDMNILIFKKLSHDHQSP